MRLLDAQRPLVFLLLAFAGLAVAQDSGREQQNAAPDRSRDGSLLSRPYYSGEAPPPLRAARNILLLHKGVSQRVLRHSSNRSFEEAMTLAKSILDELEAGADFGELARKHSALPSRRFGGHMGAYPPRMLSGPMDEFLFRARIGELSDPLVTVMGIQIMMRVDARAGVRQIFLRGADAEPRIREVRERLRAGADFAKVASELSEDDASKARGGDYAIYVRGSKDTLIKKAAFEMPVGSVSEPLQSPIGWHIIERVDPSALDPSLEEDNFIRVRAILTAFRHAVAAPDGIERTKEEAYVIAKQIYDLVAAGEPMEKYAKSEFQDDPGGRERAGDLGWVYRGNPDLPNLIEDLFLVDPGTLTEPRETTAGYVVLRREQ